MSEIVTERLEQKEKVMSYFNLGLCLIYVRKVFTEKA